MVSSLSGISAEINNLRQASMRTASRIAELEALTGDSYGPQLPGVAKSVGSHGIDPYEVLTVDGLPVRRDPLLERELSNPDPALREAAWQALFGRKN